MTRTSSTDGWTLNQGLAAQYAAQAGLDPDLAAEAGEEVWDVLKPLRDATSETDPKRQAKLIRRTKTRLAKANLSRHGDLVQHIEAKLLALQGRGGDTELAHLTPGEMVVPPQLQTPAVVQALRQAAHNAGVDLRRYTAGSPASSVNPETGLEEYLFDCVNEEGGCEMTPTPALDPIVADPIQTVVHNFHFDKNGMLTPNQPGVTSYDPSQFSGIGANPNISLNPVGPGSILPESGITPHGPQTPDVSSPEPMEQPPIPVSMSLKEVLTDPESASDARLLSAISELNNNAMLVGLNLAAASLFMPGMGKAVVAGGGSAGGVALYIIFLNRIEHEIQNRKDAGTWTVQR